jgi:Pentapeptide repeats (8 copies)
MANEEHLARLKQGVAAWNQWREANPDIQPILTGADLREADLTEAHLFETDLQGANLNMANLHGADLSVANLTKACLFRANFTRAILSSANLTAAYLNGVDLTEANLSVAKLERVLLVQTKFERANLTGCKIYGISVWNVNLIGAQQSDLIITPEHEPMITVDNLEVAQFIYLLLHNEKIREVIDTITSKAVLILGRFTPERKALLDAIQGEIRRQKLLPILFDFTPTTSQTTLETVSTLAHMAHFVIADLTDAKSILQELQAIVPNNPSVPVQPILPASQAEPGVFDFFRHYPWVLETYRYHSVEEVLTAIEKIIARAKKAKERSGTVST